MIEPQQRWTAHAVVCWSWMVLGIVAPVCGGQSSDDWLSWRGPFRNGTTAGQRPPTTWSEQEHVLWKVPVPGRGHASPLIVGDQVILATADLATQTQRVVSFDFATGQPRWDSLVFEGNFNPKIYPTNTHASSTVVSDGRRLLAVFNNERAAKLACLDLDGKIVWSKKAADFVPKKYQFGFGASPVIYGEWVIVTSECEGEGSIAAFAIADGTEIWRIPRPRATSYSTPSIATVAGREQLFLSGGGKVSSYDPRSGQLGWEIDGPWEVTCGTAVWDDERIFVSGGYPTGRTLAIRADGSGEVVWENAIRFYEQSLLYHQGYVYGLADNGVAYCFRATDGQEMWHQRLESKESASPVLAGEHIYVTAESGRTYVFRPNPEKFELVATNALGDTAYATPSFARNRILFRVASGPAGEKQEFLYCLGDSR